jgi:hypothetical protein
VHYLRSESSKGSVVSESPPARTSVRRKGDHFQRSKMRRKGQRDFSTSRKSATLHSSYSSLISFKSFVLRNGSLTNGVSWSTCVSGAVCTSEMVFSTSLAWQVLQLGGPIANGVVATSLAWPTVDVSVCDNATLLCSRRHHTDANKKIGDANFVTLLFITLSYMVISFFKTVTCVIGYFWNWKISMKLTRWRKSGLVEL